MTAFSEETSFASAAARFRAVLLARYFSRGSSCAVLLAHPSAIYAGGGTVSEGTVSGGGGTGVGVGKTCRVHGVAGASAVTNRSCMAVPAATPASVARFPLVLQMVT